MLVKRNVQDLKTKNNKIGLMFWMLETTDTKVVTSRDKNNVTAAKKLIFSKNELIH